MKMSDFLDKIYLSLSDCDGMCSHCSPPLLKSKCEKHKRNRHETKIVTFKAAN